MNVFNVLSGAKQYKDPFGKFSFQYKVNVRRSLRRKSPRNTFGSLVNFDTDFDVGLDYEGPVVTADVKPRDVAQVELWFRQERLLHRKFVYRILQLAEGFYRNNCPILVDIRVPKDGVINVAGDVHGQLYDLLKLFKLRGPPSANNLYLFNGDIVDKGPKSIECILLLFLLKLVYPNYVFINRGNHESSLVNTRNGFAQEIRNKYDDFFLFEFFGEVFRWMPVAHLIEGRIVVVHGGLSSNRELTLQDIRAIKRPVEPHTHELVGELLWSDPCTSFGVTPSTRGIGIFFGQDITRNFLERNALLCIIRSHSEIKEGCGLSHEGCYTVYSAPCMNKGVLGGVMEIQGRHLAKEGHVFQECTFDEITQFQTQEISVLLHSTSV